MPQTPEASRPISLAKPGFEPKASDKSIDMARKRGSLSGQPEAYVEGINMPVTITPQEADEFRQNPQSSPYGSVEKRKLELVEGEDKWNPTINEGVTPEYDEYRQTMYQPEIKRLTLELESLETELKTERETIADLKQQRQELLDYLRQQSQDEERWGERAGTHYNLYLVEKGLDTGHATCGIRNGRRQTIQHQLDQVNQLQSRYSQPRAA